MKLVVQRVKNAKLSVDDKEISKIDEGLVIFFGVGKGDEKKDADFFAKKITNLRIFEDENGKMNLSIKDIKGEILLVSQFTLYADTSHGNRPSFFDAETPEKANEIYEYFATKLREENISTKTGVFGADMQIQQHNNGPVTIIF